MELLLKKTQILDCTLRDGGYYNDWDFNDSIVEAYINGINNLPIDYIEVGYRSKPTEEYQGKFGYSPVHELRQIRQQTNKKIAVMLNEKSTKPADLQQLTEPIQGLVDMVRLAVAPDNLQRATTLAKAVKEQGFEVAFNIMYMSTWNQYENFYEHLKALNGIVDIVNMVDSFGGVMPNDVTTIVDKLRQTISCKIGFHGHNNLQMGLINTLTAINCGIDSVDCTILGMGRGAGNLNTELLLSYLNSKGLDVDFNTMSEVITAFQPLYETYRWGTQLPYMISGANSLPQKEVMSLVTNRVYSFDSVIRGLQNKKNKVADNAKYPILSEDKFDDVVIIGGGVSPLDHLEAIVQFVRQKQSVALVFASSRHVAYYQDLDVPEFFCLMGREAKRLAKNAKQPFTGKCVLLPYPRKLGTEVPDFATDKTFELSGISFTDHYLDSCTTLAIETALCLSNKNIYVVGYDGYASTVLSEKEIALTNENRTLFEDYHKYTGNRLVSLTKSLYQELNVVSIYQFMK